MNAVSNGPGNDKCIWSCESLGSQHYVAWECDSRPLKQVPVDAVDARFEWFSKHSLGWLASIQTKLWDAAATGNLLSAQLSTIILIS